MSALRNPYKHGSTHHSADPRDCIHCIRQKVFCEGVRAAIAWLRDESFARQRDMTYGPIADRLEALLKEQDDGTT